MNDLIQEMEIYAAENDIPIMQKEGIEFFKQLIQKYKIKSILEIGTAIGYSAIQLASLDSKIQIVSIERDEERYQRAVENVAKSQCGDQIKLVLADALECEIEGQFDCIFIDAAKAQYIRFFEKYKKNLNNDGLIVSDNLSFHGYVEHPELQMSRNLRQLVGKIKKYIDFLENNDEFETEFVKLGDGIAISRKKH